MTWWGYNENINKPPHERDSLRTDHGDPDRLPPSWQRYVGAVLVIAVFLLVLFIVER